MTQHKTKLFAFGAFYRTNQPEGIQIMFRNSVDTFDNLHSTVLELLDNMIADETLTEEEVRLQLKHFIVEYKFELDLHGAVDTPTMVSLAVLIMGNIGWLQHQDLIPIDDNNGMFFANFL